MGSENEDHHVHFVIQDTFEHSNNIVYQRHGSKLDVHLGFLQINHKYQIKLELDESLLNFKQIENGSLKLVEEERKVPNINVRLFEFSPKDNNYELVIEFFAHKEKLVKDELTLVNVDNNEEKQKFVFHARVLGRGKGTPMLRNGIRCIEVKNDEESEATS
jgi:hypothetical protein